MNVENKLNIHYSSLVGLKTELLRKQAEVEAAKEKQRHFKSIFNKTKTKDKVANEKQKTKKVEKNKKSNEKEDIECMKTLQKSKLMLQAKSRLYETLSKTRTNINSNFLVDFINKSGDSNCFAKEHREVNNDYKSDFNSENEWVEYTDCFGRTRKCLKEDLPKMQEKDEFIRKNINHKSRDETKGQLLYVEDKLPRKEPAIEMMRKKWEEQTVKLTNKVNIHYEDVLFDEARAHGVGYYAFSQDEEERIKQQESLLKLRKETEKKQNENHEINEMKEKLQQNRLRVARLRQKIRSGLSIKEIEKEMTVHNSMTFSKSENHVKQDDVINNKKGNQSAQGNVISSCEQTNKTNSYEQRNKQEADKKEFLDIESKIQAFGQLLGKRNRWYIMSQEEWVHKKRKERVEEFGPIYKNFKNEKSLNLNKCINSDITSADLMNSYNSSDDNDLSSVEQMILSENNSIVRPNLDIYKSANVKSVSISQNKSNILNSATITKEVISQSLRDINVNENIACQIEAGLKYLREQFENNHT